MNDFKKLSIFQRSSNTRKQTGFQLFQVNLYMDSEDN